MVGLPKERRSVGSIPSEATNYKLDLDEIFL